MSYFSRAQYGYKDKYLLSASLREDGSSSFGANNKYGVFPSASVGWRIIQEDFMKKLPVISDLKLRFSYGVNGNNAIAEIMEVLHKLGSYGYVFGTTSGVGYWAGPKQFGQPRYSDGKNHKHMISVRLRFFQKPLNGVI